ncbi:hydantoinase B/oxoprolinase family protein [Alicyclobacillus sp. ALC3]|uniref:hydantoinase B/oxoprolinase family protein n=1 Tax=Alicyclobacillus sp. ALC3 TaxID=2796143 RepID=UPI00237950AE|nr:hydantoinase B/oxoprolinase family protein [Alicyclobacillus sp. ALC3]WDL97698.1 hydantoinase B/oxoprolinase family protein [Alicyclobacillus sp. ALC3]
MTTHAPLDTITLDIIENALKNARFEMDAVLYRAAMSPIVREQHDEFPMICDRFGRMVVGQFGSHIPSIVEYFKDGILPGDVVLLSDPYLCAGSISHVNDWLVIIPVYFHGDLVGYTSMFGHMMDVGGPVPGSQPAAARTIFGEGIKIPPVKIYEGGKLNRTALDVILNNTRTPEMNETDLMALIAGCRTAEKRVVELCERFGQERYLSALDSLLERTRNAMKQLIVKMIPENKISFVDFVDDDGLGNGPFVMKLTIWREGEKAFFDFTGTDGQALGPINFHINEGLAKLFIGVYMIMAYDPQILFNDGFYDLFEVVLPEGSLLNPKFPAAVGNRLNTHTRLFDVISGALGINNPQLAMAAGYGTSPYFVYSGNDPEGRYFQMVELLYGGVPGRPIGDGLDGHSWWPLFTATPAEYNECYYPVRVDKYDTALDTAGPGKHRGGAGIEKVYTFLSDGEVSINDDRAVSHPWGIFGGKCGGLSSKTLVRHDGTEESLESKKDFVRVSAGDQLVYRTAGAGGWGDPLDRPADRVRFDVIAGIVSMDSAKEDYGVVMDASSFEVDVEETELLRREMRAERGNVPAFHFGPLVDEYRKQRGVQDSTDGMYV